MFAIPAIRSIKEYNPRYILADKAYDTEKIKKTIIEETTAIPQIPTKNTKKQEMPEQYSGKIDTNTETK